MAAFGRNIVHLGSCIEDRCATQFAALDLISGQSLSDTTKANSHLRFYGESELFGARQVMSGGFICRLA